MADASGDAATPAQPSTPPKPAPVEDRRADLTHELDLLKAEIEVAAEWGIFGVGPDAIARDLVIATLKKASDALAAGRLDEADQAVFEARISYGEKQNSSWIWGLNNRFGFLPLLLMALSATLTYRLFFELKLGMTADEILRDASFAGMVGAVLKSMYWVQFQTSRGMLTPRWCATFIVGPPIGVILGWLVSLMVAAGVRAVASQPAAAQTDWRTVSLLAAFAGYKWEWALGVLRDIAKSFQPKTPGKPDKPQGN